MSDDDDGLAELLHRFGFTEDEVSQVVDELNSFRAIPGTTVERYVNRIINTLDDEDRPAFLKGIMAGLTIRIADEALYEPYYAKDEMKIDMELQRLRFER